MDYTDCCPSCKKPGKNQPGTNAYYCIDCMNVWSVPGIMRDTDFSNGKVKLGSKIRHSHHGIGLYKGIISGDSLGSLADPTLKYITLEFPDSSNLIIYVPLERAGSLKLA